MRRKQEVSFLFGDLGQCRLLGFTPFLGYLLLLFVFLTFSHLGWFATSAFLPLAKLSVSYLSNPSPQALGDWFVTHMHIDSAVRTCMCIFSVQVCMCAYVHRKFHKFTHTLLIALTNRFILDIIQVHLHAQIYTPLRTTSSCTIS